MGYSQDTLSSAPPVEVQMLDKLDQLLKELRGIRLAIVHIATQDGKAFPDDFDLEAPFAEDFQISQ